jgi:3-hydroxyisobutyrate dehydrogenase-like beta-hydroxyacid dehydrogenase
MRVLTALDGRSERTRERAAVAKLQDAGNLVSLVRSVDVILSILEPSSAIDVARQVAEAMRETRATLLYVDCNSITPRAAQTIGDIISAAGGRVADAGIHGLPPQETSTPMYASGPGAAEFAQLNAYGFDVRIIGEELGQASAMELVCAGLIKAVLAVGIELLIAAELSGVSAAVAGELHTYLREVTPPLERYAGVTPSRAARWRGEMQQTSEFLNALGLPGTPFRGAAEVFDLIAPTPLAQQAKDTGPQHLSDVIAELAAQITPIAPMP